MARSPIQRVDYRSQMRRVSGNGFIPAPPADVYAFLAEPTNLPRWQEGVVTKKLADVACGDRQCYQVSVSVPSSLMNEAGAVASLDPSTIFGDAVVVNLLFDREKLWLTEVSTGIDSESIGTITATLSFSNFDEAVEFSAPPSPDVTEGEFTLPGM